MASSKMLLEKAAAGNLLHIIHYFLMLLLQYRSVSVSLLLLFCLFVSYLGCQIYLFIDYSVLEGRSIDCFGANDTWLFLS